MASIEKRGGKWRARWYEPGGKHRSKTFDRKIDAERWLTKVGHDLLTGAYVDPTAGQITFETYAAQWRAGKRHREGTAAQAESHLRLHVYPHIGSMPLARVRRSDIQRVVNIAATTLAASTVETMYAYVANVFKVAVQDRLLAASPCVEIDLPEKAGSAPLELMTAEQVAAAAEHINSRYRLAVVLGASAGLRPAEVLGLAVDRVDFLRRSIRVDQQLWTPPKGRPRLAEPKTVTSTRVVPVPQLVIDEIAAHIGRWGTASTGNLLLSTATRGMVRRGRYNDSWNVVRGEHVPTWATPHDLRHFYASMLIAQGHDVKTIQRRLGHKSASTTLDTYGHLWGDHEDRTREAVEHVLGPVLAPKRARRRRVARP